MSSNTLPAAMPVSANPRQDLGKMEYGCEHYRRRCKIIAPCCNEMYPCRHCHDESKNALDNFMEVHELVRRDVQKVVCSICNTEQQVTQVCSRCGINMGEYFCGECNFYDDDTTKGQFHCKDCGICRVGEREKFFHCQKCGCCLAQKLRNRHSCVENSMKQDCPICKESKGFGLWSHDTCKYACPICCKSMFDMSRLWMKLDQEVESYPMPEDFKDWKIGHKCVPCGSYNTRRIVSTAAGD